VSENVQEGVFAIDEDDGDDDDEDDDDDDDVPSWSNLETVNSCHPLYFARMIVEVTTFNIIHQCNNVYLSITLITIMLLTDIARVRANPI
jgi:hypothetical protein